MARETALVNGVEKVVVIRGEEAVGVDHNPLAGGKRLNLRLHPVGLGNREGLALVGLHLMDDIILPVEVHTEADAVLPDPTDADLTVPPLDPKEIEDPMLIGRSRRRVLVTEIALSNAELDVPPVGKGLGLPIAHHRRGV